MKTYNFFEAMRMIDEGKTMRSYHGYNYNKRNNRLTVLNYSSITMVRSELENPWTEYTEPFEVKVGDKFRNPQDSMSILEVFKIHNGRAALIWIYDNELYVHGYSFKTLEKMERVK